MGAVFSWGGGTLGSVLPCGEGLILGTVFSCGGLASDAVFSCGWGVSMACVQPLRHYSQFTNSLFTTLRSHNIHVKPNWWTWSGRAMLGQAASGTPSRRHAPGKRRAVWLGRWMTLSQHWQILFSSCPNIKFSHT